ncbi:MAG: hypothetical protein M3540_08245, partial [Actinomycetota bacterium]|nr:hypothetical protein [Actinomycetota bacterium]
ACTVALEVTGICRDVCFLNTADTWDDDQASLGSANVAGFTPETARRPSSAACRRKVDLMRIPSIIIAVAVASVLSLAIQTDAAQGQRPGRVQSLTEREKALARAIVDREALRLTGLSPRSVTITGIFPWYTASYRPIGAAVHLRFASAMPIAGRIPVLDQEGLGADEMYRSHIADMVVNRVTEIYAMVDLHQNALAGLYLHGPEIQYVRPREEPSRPSMSRFRPERATPYPPAEGGGFGYIVVDGYNQFYNWDMTSQNLSPSEADWPSTLIFGNNATIMKVKNGLEGQGYAAHPATPMYGYLTQGPGSCCVWDADEGRKTGPCSGTHYRVYADADERMYTPSWGYFVMATTHRDNDECPFGASPTAGWSEEAEANVTAASSAVGWSAYPDYLLFNNSVVTSWIGNRYYQNNGYGTLITMP